MKKFKIVGARVLFVVRPQTEGSDCEFTEAPGIEEEYEILLEEQGCKWGTQLWQLNLSSSSEVCSSGFGISSYAEYELEQVEDRGPITHLPTQEIALELEDPRDLPEAFECKGFEWSKYGKDECYPTGYASFNTEMFWQTGRGHQKPVVWVMTGPSNMGKSTLAKTTKTIGLNVYETDQDKILAENLVYAQVIVIGGKYPHSIDGIRAVFKKYELDIDLIPVAFG